MNSRLSTILALALLLTSFQPTKQQQPDRPNILWIVSEDNSPLLGCYGDSFATSPNIDRLASEGVLYTNAFATAPVCAPSRNTLITGVYPPSLGTENMRSTYPVPDFVHFFPRYLREAGYYTSNNAKKDYNTIDQDSTWNESSKAATYLNRKDGQPFYAVFNIEISHESSLHTVIPNEKLRHNPKQVKPPPYHPDTPEMRHDWAQYYDKVEDMDTQVGKLLADLEKSGEANNTIVFYYSDHGGVLGRSKRFMYESGLHIPLVIRFPKKYAHLAPGKPGTQTDRIVTFLDFAPTVLSLAGVKAPAYMQGKAFLGSHEAAPRSYAYGFRGRMDERTDLSRSVRDKKYRYIRNYMPHKIYGQYIEYLWRAPSLRSWEAAYKSGKLNETQRKFWETKPTEELFDIEADPNNVHNLAGDPAYKSVLEKLRKVNHNWLLTTKDVGFVPEARIEEISQKMSPYTYAQSGQYKAATVIETAELASEGKPENLDRLIRLLSHSDANVRYWAATGCTILGSRALPAKSRLGELLKDPEISVRLAAAESLVTMGASQEALPVLSNALKSPIQMARVQALSVIDKLSPAEKAQLLPAVKELVKSKMKNADYDLRAAEHIVDRNPSIP